MNNISLPQISQSELENLLSEARNSPRRRYPKILHEKGDVLNRVINFMLDDTYMEPHLHPGFEKIEDGSFLLVRCPSPTWNFSLFLPTYYDFSCV